MAVIALVASDTQPTRLTYKTAGGAPIPITGYGFVLHIGYDTPLAKAAVIVDADGGVLEFPWASGDLVAGEYQIEIIVTDAAGKTKTIKLGTVVIGSRIA